LAYFSIGHPQHEQCLLLGYGAGLAGTFGGSSIACGRKAGGGRRRSNGPVSVDAAGIGAAISDYYASRLSVYLLQNVTFGRLQDIVSMSK
jgi:hypothetical protein